MIPIKVNREVLNDRFEQAQAVFLSLSPKDAAVNAAFLAVLTDLLAGTSDSSKSLMAELIVYMRCNLDEKFELDQVIDRVTEIQAKLERDSRERN